MQHFANYRLIENFLDQSDGDGDGDADVNVDQDMDADGGFEHFDNKMLNVDLIDGAQ